MTTQSEVQSNSSDAVKAFSKYPFDDDETYQQGLSSILAGNAFGSSSTPEEKDVIVLKTRVFYFNKIKGTALTLHEVVDYGKQAMTSTGSVEPGAVKNENRVLTFAELKELIETGNVDKIPNNKIIPEKINDAPPTQSTAPTRKKPWEIAAVQ